MDGAGKGRRAGTLPLRPQNHLRISFSTGLGSKLPLPVTLHTDCTLGLAGTTAQG